MAKINSGIRLGKRKKNKAVQYAIGGVVSVVVLVLWITSPIMGNVFSSASVAAGNPFSSRVTDVSALSSDGSFKSSAEKMVEEMGSHDSGDGILSTLFQSGFDEENKEYADSGAGSSAASTDSGSDSSTSAPNIPTPNAGTVSESTRAKLSALSSSLGAKGGGGSSASSGGNHNKFFGSGNNKAEIRAIDMSDVKKQVASTGNEKRGMGSLKKATTQGNLALNTSDLAQASGGVSSAFDGGTKKASSSMLSGKEEKESEVAQLGVGQAITDLKSNDPKLNSNKVTPKVTKPKDVTDEDAEIKKMLLQMLFSNVIGPVLSGAVGSAFK